MSDVIERVLGFWFLPPEKSDADAAREIWFTSDPEFDREVAERFMADYKKARRCRYDDLGQTAIGSVVLVIMLDQFPRNLFRGSAQAFATDARAREVADRALANGFDRELGTWQRMFLYLPFEHSEGFADQERSVALFTELGHAETLKYAISHRDIIQQFGRFPTRNAALGRINTAEERKFLKDFSEF